MFGFFQISVLQGFAQNNCTCSDCNIPCSSPSSSHWSKNCPVVKSRSTGTQNSGTSTSTGSGSASFEQEIMTQIFSTMITNVFSKSTTPTTQQSDEEKQKQLQAEKLRQQRIDELMKRQKRINDSLAQVRHEKMKKDYKPLDSTGNVTYKGLDDGKQFQKVNFSCKITEFKGQVLYMKSDGTEMMLTENSSVDLAPGDWIATGPYSRVKLHYAFEKGGKDVILGQNSGLTIITEEDGQHTPTQVAGNLYAITDFVSEISTITKEEIEYKIDQVISTGKSSYYLLKKCNRVRITSACCCIRGTEFSSSIDSLGNSTVYVFEGMIDLYGKTDESVVTLTAGYYGVVNAEGKIVKYEKFEMEKFERWWEE